MATTEKQTGTGLKGMKLAEKPSLATEKHQEKLTQGRTLLEFEIGPATETTSTLLP